MLKKQIILKFAMIISMATLLAITSSACIAPSVENSYEEILQISIPETTTQESTVPETIISTGYAKPPITADKIKENYMKDVMEMILDPVTGAQPKLSNVFTLD